jgi:hypothetical protein
MTPVPGYIDYTWKRLQEIERAKQHADRQWERIAQQAFALVARGASRTGRPPEGSAPVRAELDGDLIRVHLDWTGQIGDALQALRTGAPLPAERPPPDPIIFPAAWLIMSEAEWLPLLEAEVDAACKRHDPES